MSLAWNASNARLTVAETLICRAVLLAFCELKLACSMVLLGVDRVVEALADVEPVELFQPIGRPVAKPAGAEACPAGVGRLQGALEVLSPHPHPRSLARVSSSRIANLMPYGRDGAPAGSVSIRWTERTAPVGAYRTTW